MKAKIYLGLIIASAVGAVALIAPKSPVSAKETVLAPVISKLEARHAMLQGI